MLDDVCSEVAKTFVGFSFAENVSPEKDSVLSYAKKLLGSGLFYLEFCDAIKEGDGTRVAQCYRYLLPIFFGTGKTNYSCEVLNMLHHELTLPPRLANQLLWSRFVNTHGAPGRNIPCTWSTSTGWQRMRSEVWVQTKQSGQLRGSVKPLVHLHLYWSLLIEKSM